ncbi:hypothetical protein ANRL3_00593 [Anaerolineae bacterium]|nr:hypothetical protein ANRL3_00593 [Anaerolineae bacterium]
MKHNSEIRNSKFNIRVANREFQISNFEFLISSAVALACFALYLRTLAPDVVDADGGEFQFAAWNFGFVHPTGYPLFLILGGAFQHLVPIGNPAFRLNLFNAILAALAVGALYLAINELTRQRAASVIAALSFALTRTFWYDAGAVEVYAFNAFFLTLLLFIVVRWQTSPNAKTFAAFCFVFGLALTHHRSAILWLPAFALFIFLAAWRARFQVSPSHFLLFVFSFLLPLSLYLYLPLRASASPYATLALAPGHDLVLFDNSLGGFVNYVLGRTFQDELRWDAISIARLVAFPQALLDQFGAMGVALGIVGLIAMFWRKRKAWARLALMLTAFITTILFASVYHIGDIAHYYIPAYLVWVLWIGVAIRAIADRITHYQLLAPILVTLLLLVPQLITNFSFADRRRETQPREQWTRILSAPIPPNAILISNDRDEMMPLWYMQYVENTRRDLLGLFPLVTPDRTNIARLTDSVLDSNRPVFFIKAMPGIEIKYKVGESNAPLVRVLGRATDAPPQNAANAILADKVKIIGYDATRQGADLRVVVYWQPLAKLGYNYTTSVQLFDARGGKIAQGNDHQVGGEFYPTSLWEASEILRDEHVLLLPPASVQGKYHLFVGMYRSSDLEPLGEPAEIGIIDLK